MAPKDIITLASSLRVAMLLSLKLDAPSQRKFYEIVEHSATFQEQDLAPLSCLGIDTKSLLTNIVSPEELHYFLLIFPCIHAYRDLEKLESTFTKMI